MEKVGVIAAGITPPESSDLSGPEKRGADQEDQLEDHTITRLANAVRDGAAPRNSSDD